ncbi:FtsK/SpoIIIE domain-containing protein [Microbacterium sp. p3-SID336]|uniref:FtsK/SpoIIIE domain-containing protein n=1 Tax=Microbacterium sp. p3-SID336 TaxID=2916212 RepID=UPI0021A85E8B|nr:FtsK/SpoIIIE domain-containing protein [Microbacterium sp. p3-SID336]MCT1478937.1 FtsK/SpoIIIE domain-containing protein [Microbacterium sp. p3-SID336]
MKVRLTLLRQGAASSDIEVTAESTATIGDIAAMIVRADPLGAFAHADPSAVTLEAYSSVVSGAGDLLAPESTFAHVGLAHGATVRVVPASYEQRPVVGRLEVGAGQGARSIALTRGTIVLGRDESCDVVIDDPLVSKKHARLEIGDRVELIDLNSANGILVDGASVVRLVAAEGELAVVLGDTPVRVQVETGVAGPTTAEASIRQVEFVRSPRVEERYLGEELDGTDLPVPARKQPFPLLTLVAPLLMGGAMYFFTQSILSIMFVALSPLLMIGTWLTTKNQQKRELEEDKKRFEEQLERLEARLQSEREREIDVRRREVPLLREVSDAALAAGPLIWTRRTEHWSFLHVRLGIGDTGSRSSVKDSNGRDRAIPEYVEKLDAVVDATRIVPQVPILEDLTDVGALGIAGLGGRSTGYARALLAQLTGLHAPADLGVVGLWGPRWGAQLADAKWLPHAWSAQAVLGVQPIGDGPTSAGQIVARLEELIATRSTRSGDAVELGALEAEKAATNSGSKVGEDSRNRHDAVPKPAIVVLIAPDAPVDRGRLIQLSERAASRGIFPVWLTEDTASLPASCRTFVQLAATDSAHFVRLGEVIDDLAVDELTREQFAVFARALARLTDAGEVALDRSDVPRTISMLHLLGRDMATQPESVVDRWTQNDSLHSRRKVGSARRYQPKLRALVGAGAEGALQLDLRQQGPHALVGGTTGSGKSEFLQAWVLGMATEYSPERLTFLFVDYKGGSAFADCVSLPHCVGIVTDLNEHLVRRVLVSLRAELHYREHLFNRKKAKDILELERAGDPQAPPALVLVIDEFAALAKEVPEFVDGVIDIAQRGRSLGIHLIMATQRPAGVIKDNLRANTNLRVALRMADETDSNDVIGTKDAALFDPGTPGRGIAKTGPGRMTLFQSAYSGGWSLGESDSTDVAIAAFGSTDQGSWELPIDESAVVVDEDLGPNDQQRLVSTMVLAAQAAQVAQPRRPWLDELAPTFDQLKLPQRTDAALLLGVIDEPERQEQVPFHFLPDTEGHMVIYGTSGSGKSAALRTLAVSAGITPRGGPVQVYGLDFGSGALRMLEPLPHVGSVISGDDAERVARLFATLRQELDRRGDAYSAVGAATLTEYRQLSGKTDEPRILVLIDGFAAFRNDYEAVIGRTDTYNALQEVLSDGRAVGIHVVLSADRFQSIPSALNAMLQRRVVLRMADTDAYNILNVPKDVLTPESVPGRAIVGENEAQIAIIGGTRSMKEQSLAIERMAASMSRRGVPDAPPVRALPLRYGVEEIPATVGDQLVVGLADSDLGPFGIEPTGTFVIAGPPASGKSNALAAIAQQVLRARPGTPTLFLGSTRSPARAAVTWTSTAADGISGTAAVAEIVEKAEQGLKPVVAVEGVAEFASSLLEMPLSDLVKRATRGELLLLFTGDTSEWTSNFGLLGEIKQARRGVVLQPETIDGELVLKAPLPRIGRGEFPVGRAVLAQRGKIVRVQFPLVIPETV